MKIICNHRFEDLIHIENLLLAWEEFLKGKKQKKDVQQFQFNLMDNILSLNRDLSNGTYRHGKYYEFNISDPKPRIIHKATVRDRLLHHAVYRVLYPFFDDTFIADSFSCRIDKGTHKAMARFKTFANIVSRNNTKTCWILKCDIKKFFASIDQNILLNILDERIKDKRIVAVLQNIIESFNSGRPRTGLPLGNLTSQLFSNVYMNEFDQFVKHKLKLKYYIRYADDFVIFSDDKTYLEQVIMLMAEFLHDTLKLTLHPDKIYIKTLAQGVDFLGWVHFFDHRVLRTVTKDRMFKKLEKTRKPQVLASYLGLLGYGDTGNIKEKVFHLTGFFKKL
ncbi:MAG: hypothetical protein EXS48_00215 [Candidatus Staskawiczbacteria bacterium]|nr:hypothetical protein [Candidatus Staskawiczbacteria bacterium]